MIKWFIIIVIVVYVISKLKDSSTNETKPKDTTSNAVFSMKVFSPQTYSSVLNNLENIVEQVISKSHCEVSVVVSVRKKDNMYCNVSCSMLADTDFRSITFGEGFVVNGNDFAKFETDIATGFTTPEDVKKEIQLQFNWSNISLSKTRMTVIDYGDFTSTPYVSYSFTGRKV